jgi:hypothetical protein
MKKFLKWGCLITVTLLIVVMAFAWRQVRRLRHNLKVETPLPIAEVRSDPSEAERLMDRVDRAQVDRVVRLRDVELTWLAQKVLAHPKAQAELRNAQTRAIKALASIPDPMGFLECLRLEAVDVTRAIADVRVTDRQLHIRLTAPYRGEPGHLNVQLGGTGGWAAGAVRLQVTQLTVGEMDVMALPFYGSLIESRVDEGVVRLARMKTSGPIEDVRIEENAVVLRLKPDGASILREAIRRYLR